MGGKGLGNKLAYKNARGAKSPVIGDNGLSVKPGEMADIVRNCVTAGSPRCNAIKKSLEILSSIREARKVTKWL